ncbi:HNH endonuclease signature motif containing protein [Cryobacterium sp. TMT1-3]|uniref:HNH endonuclease signature motif containing protein n=1 Tax=Cryobacterium sp. TMT1-3 TaxID=1259237 RepID=UPI0018E09EC9|nr:HNH endonuclease signature motif containing protein [Cryobacterium sp. TMT1-3]
MTLTAPPAAAGPVPEGSRVEAVAQAGALLAAAFDGVTFGYFDDAEAIAVLAALEGLGRKLDGARLRSTTDLQAGRGVGWIDGIDAPISMRRVKETICTGGSQHVIFGENGAMLYLGETVRRFAPKQRAAIAARDGGCIIPGCTIPARWTEVHHIIPAGKGGPTNVDNGTNLCWFHHHTIDTNGWQIRMINGRPQVRGPLLWDPTQTWRPAHTHRANTPSPEPPWRT